MNEWAHVNSIEIIGSNVNIIIEVREYGSIHKVSIEIEVFKKHTGGHLATTRVF